MSELRHAEMRLDFKGKPSIVWTINDPDEAEYLVEVLSPFWWRGDRGAGDIVKRLVICIGDLWGDDGAT